MIRSIAFGLIGLTGMLLVVGCGNKSASVPTSSGVTDVSTPSSYNSTQYNPPAPVTTSAQPVTYDTMPAVNGGGTTSGGSGPYTVRKGDTLYSIARTHYGDGKQWQKIAAANPGIRPETLKVGQQITIP